MEVSSPPSTTRACARSKMCTHASTNACLSAWMKCRPTRVRIERMHVGHSLLFMPRRASSCHANSPVHRSSPTHRPEAGDFDPLLEQGQPVRKAPPHLSSRRHRGCGGERGVRTSIPIPSHSHDEVDGGGTKRSQRRPVDATTV